MRDTINNQDYALLLPGAYLLHLFTVQNILYYMHILLAKRLLYCTLFSENTISMHRVFLKLRRSNWTSCLTYLESIFSLLGYLGVDIFMNKTLNSHVGPIRSHEEFLCNELFDWAFGDDKDDLNEACCIQVRLSRKSRLILLLGLHLQHDKRCPSPTKPTYSSASHYKLP